MRGVIGVIGVIGGSGGRERGGELEDCAVVSVVAGVWTVNN